MKTKIAAIAVATLVAVMTMPVAFAKSDADVAEMFKQLDTDQSGGISLSEAEAHPDLSDSFSDGDENEDGQLDMAEFSKMEVVDE